MVTRYVDAVDRALLYDGPDIRSRLQSRHLDVPAVHDLCTHATILERVRAILGDAVVLWRSNFFAKEPGAQAFEWHRDRDHWKTLLDPMINVTAWLALEPATRENGCVETRSGPVELDRGECFMFDQDEEHRSGPNRSMKRRLGLAIRFTLPNVTIDRGRLFPGYRAIEL